MYDQPFCITCIYSLHKSKSNNYSLKSAQYKSVIRLWEDDDAKYLYLVLKVSCQRYLAEDCQYQVQLFCIVQFFCLTLFYRCLNCNGLGTAGANTLKT